VAALSHEEYRGLSDARPGTKSNTEPMKAEIS
jgi:hypothetical protein